MTNEEILTRVLRATIARMTSAESYGEYRELRWALEKLSADVEAGKPLVLPRWVDDYE